MSDSRRDHPTAPTLEKNEGKPKAPTQTSSLDRLMRRIKNLLVGLLLVSLATIFDNHFHKEGKMSTRTERKVWFAMCILILIVTTCTTFVLKAQAPKDTFQVEIWPASLADTLYGETRCNGNHILVLISESSSPDQKILTKMHEMIHVNQVTRVGCKKSDELYAANPFIMELEAWCPLYSASLAVQSDLLKRAEIRLDFIKFMKTKYGKKLSLKEVSSKVDNCMDRRIYDPP